MNPPPPANLVLRGGRILTLASWSPGRPPDEEHAIAICDGIVVAAGGDDSGWIGPDTRIVELRGRTVLPGINDTHLHLVCYAMAGFGLREVPTDSGCEAL